MRTQRTKGIPCSNMKEFDALGEPSKFAKLDEWMAAQNGKNIRHEELKNGDCLDWIVINGRVLILQSFANDNGWDIYVPATDSNSVDATLKALEIRLAPSKAGNPQ